MKRLLAILLLLPSLLWAETVSVIVDAPTQAVTVETLSTTITPAVVTVTAIVNIVSTDTVEVTVPGPQGPAGATTAGTGGGTWGTIDGTLSDQTDLQAALDTKATTGGIIQANLFTTQAAGSESYTSFDSSGLHLSMAGLYNTMESTPDGFQFHSDGRIYFYDGGANTVTVDGMAEHILSTTAAHGGLATVATSGSYPDLINKPSIPAAQVNSDWNASSGVAQILNKPTPLNGYDGYDGSQIFAGAGTPGSGIGTASDYYLNSTNGDFYLKTGSPAAWALQGNLKGVTGNNGTNGANGADGAAGDNYSCAITGGIRTLEYDKNGSNPAPTMVAFGSEMRKNGSVVTPATYDWSTPSSGSLLSGSGSAATFTPTVNGTFTAATDNRVDVALTYSGITCRATAPVPCTKIGSDGAQGSDNKAQIYAKITAAATGDVLNTQCGSGDAASFAGRTVRATGGDIHRADLCGGTTWFYARPTDAATTPKVGIKTSGGTPIIQFNADGSFTGTLVIR